MATGRPTLAKVALAAGVSKTLASNALNGRGRVSDETRSRVLAAAEQLGYQANPAAKSLRHGSAPMIAIHLDERCLAPAGGLYPFWRRFVTGVLEVAAASGYHTIVDISDDSERLMGAPADALVSVSNEISAVFGDTTETSPTSQHRLTRDEIASTQVRTHFSSDYALASRLISQLFIDADCTEVTILPRPGGHPEVDFIVGAISELLAAAGIQCSITNPDGSKEVTAGIVRHALSVGSDGLLNFADQLPTLLDEISAAKRTVSTRATTGIVVANQSDSATELTNAEHVFFVVFDGYGTGRQVGEHVISVLQGDEVKDIRFAPSIRRFANSTSTRPAAHHD